MGGTGRDDASVFVCTIVYAFDGVRVRVWRGVMGVKPIFW